MVKEITVDELLTQQQVVKPLATIEPIEGKPESVKVTPWVQSKGCLCASTLVIPKAAISSVSPTGETHYCCGKQLHVVEINFKEDAQLSVAETFSHVASVNDYLISQKGTNSFGGMSSLPIQQILNSLPANFSRELPQQSVSYQYVPRPLPRGWLMNCYPYDGVSLSLSYFAALARCQQDGYNGLSYGYWDSFDCSNNSAFGCYPNNFALATNRYGQSYGQP
jgi:hypothetical protein